jgi:hypothetical protein
MADYFAELDLGQPSEGLLRSKRRRKLCAEAGTSSQDLHYEVSQDREAHYGEHE